MRLLCALLELKMVRETIPRVGGIRNRRSHEISSSYFALEAADVSNLVFEDQNLENFQSKNSIFDVFKPFER